ncbi:Hpt domain-containing protein [Alkalinema pantanalense CENA528]|uniref:Hpt domain-containing protein n=1 Tax=Alkalinema pantanalense TaxID=1620705 RepID=UPI003D6DCFCF
MKSSLTSRVSTVDIDWKQLHQLSDGNTEFEVELLKIFFVETKTRLQLLESALADRDCHTLQYLAHQIKGASGNVGLRKMWQAATELEKQARQQDLSHGSLLLTQLNNSLLVVQDFLEATT